ncbi:hypothetical protein ACWGK5_31420 [Rhodococcus qingshengii]
MDVHTIIADTNAHQRLLLAATLVHGSPMNLNFVTSTSVAGIDARREEYLTVCR